MSEHTYLVATDGSDCSIRAAQKAIELAKLTKAAVKLFYVIDNTHKMPLAIEGYIPPEPSEESQKANIVEHVMGPMLKELQSDEVDVSSDIVLGDPAFQITKYLKENDVSMLFVGRRSRSTVMDLLIGSLANKLAHAVEVPITLVP
ncbi:universal stress protein [Thalassotalea aquiviva]|uniref:universal stress protein n=1 Tax=Thalassotalea aquiviva TaxID=3242415 RepID=UPI00352A4743